QRYRFDYALLSRSDLSRPGLKDLLDALPEWSLVSVDDAAALYVRRTGPLASVADSLGYRLLPGGTLRLPPLATPCPRASARARRERGARAAGARLGPRAELRVAPARLRGGHARRPWARS